MRIKPYTEYETERGYKAIVEAERAPMAPGPWDFDGYVVVNGIKEYAHWSYDGTAHREEQKKGFNIIKEWVPKNNILLTELVEALRKENEELKKKDYDFTLHVKVIEDDYIVMTSPEIQGLFLASKDFNVITGNLYESIKTLTRLNKLQEFIPTPPQEKEK